MSTKDLKIISRKEAKELGLKRYFTGKPCKHGHIEERYTSNKGCKGCLKVRSSEYRNENKDKVKESLKAWRDKNKDHVKDYDRKRYEEDKKYFSEKNKRWHKKNPEKARLKTQKRKASLLDQSPILTPEEEERMLQASIKAKCFSQVTEWIFHLDHIQPISKGGLHHPDNIQILESSLNISKHNLTKEELMERDGDATKFFNGLRA